MKNRKRNLAIFFSCIIAIIIGAISFIVINNSGTEHINDKTKYEKVFLNASWSYNYSDIEELTESSDLIALIDVKSENLSSELQAGIPMSTYTANVSESVYGCENGENVDIVMTGGITNNKLYEIKDDPLMNEGDQYLIFATKNYDGTYTILSGSQGRFSFENGKISSLNESNEQVKKYNEFSNIHVKAENKTNFVNKIKEFLR